MLLVIPPFMLSSLVPDVEMILFVSFCVDSTILYMTSAANFTIIIQTSV